MWLYDLKKKKKAVKSNVLLYLNTALQGITCVRAQVILTGGILNQTTSHCIISLVQQENWLLPKGLGLITKLNKGSPPVNN